MQSSAEATIRNENGTLSLSLCILHYCKINNFFRNFSSAPFLPLLVTFDQISAMNSSGQLLFSSAPSELFGRNFGHLATLYNRTSAKGGHSKTRQGTPSLLTGWVGEGHLWQLAQTLDWSGHAIVSVQSCISQISKPFSSFFALLLLFFS